jgi:NAD(P)H-dependent FMN reductase
MHHIVILSGSVRMGRKSHRVALYMLEQIKKNKIGTVEIVDLMEYNFPIFSERLKFQTDPTDKTIEFAEKIKKADGVLIVTPEYNGGFPASVKNAVDLLNEEWHKKPIAISTVSDGVFGGSQVIVQLQFSLWKLGALTIPARFPVPNINESYDEKGIPSNPEKTDKRAAKFLGELKWWMDAISKMKETPVESNN